MVSFPEIHKPTPHQPQTLTDLQARFPAALKDSHMLDDRDDWTVRPPHRKPECIFDFDDGLRLIISFDEFPDDKEIHLHVSASFPPGCLIHRVFQSLPEVATKYAYLTGLVMAAIPMLARRTVKLRFVQIDDRGAPHFVGPTRKEWEAQCTA